MTSFPTSHARTSVPHRFHAPASDLDDWREELFWSAVFGRPVRSLRWAAAVEPVPMKLPAGRRDPDWIHPFDTFGLRDRTDLVGPEIVDGINKLAKAGAFGPQTETDDFFSRYVVLVGAAARDRVIRAASDENRNALVRFQFVEAERSGRTNLMVHLVDVDEGRVTELSTELDDNSLPAMREFVERTGAVITQVSPVAPVDSISADAAREHLARILKTPEFEHPCVPLADARLYELLGVVDRDEVRPVYERILGADDAATFLDGDDEARREVVDRFLDAPSISAQ